MGQDQVLYETDTEYGHYQVVDSYYLGRPARVLYSGEYGAAQSGVARDNKDDLLFDYNARFRDLVRGCKPRTLLIVGGGAFTLPAALAREFPALEQDVVELDGGLLDIARRFFNFQPTENVRVHIGDGRKYLAAS